MGGYWPLHRLASRKPALVVFFPGKALLQCSLLCVQESRRAHHRHHCSSFCAETGQWGNMTTLSLLICKAVSSSKSWLRVKLPFWASFHSLALCEGSHNKQLSLSLPLSSWQDTEKEATSYLYIKSSIRVRRYRSRRPHIPCIVSIYISTYM